MWKKEEITDVLGQIDILSDSLRKLQYSDPAGSKLGEIKTFSEQQLGKIEMENIKKTREGVRK